MNADGSLTIMKAVDAYYLTFKHYHNGIHCTQTHLYKADHQDSNMTNEFRLKQRTVIIAASDTELPKVNHVTNETATKEPNNSNSVQYQLLQLIHSKNRRVVLT